MQRSDILSIINQIYCFAKARNKEELTNTLKKYGTLDICFDNFTAAAQLAKEGDFKSVSFLHTHFLVDLKPIAFGLAVGGHFSMLKRINRYSVAGAARGGYFAEMLTMIKEHQSGIDAVSEVARVGKFQLVDELIALLSNPMPIPSGGSSHYFLKDVIACAAQGAAGGHFAAMNEYLNRVSSDPYHVGLNSAVKGAARGGHVEIVSYLLGQGASESEAVSGAISNCHFDLALQLINNAKNNEVVLAACRTAVACGYFDFVRKLIEANSYGILQAAFFASGKGQYEMLNQLMKWKELAGSEYDQDDMRNRIPLYTDANLLAISLIDESDLRYAWIKEGTKYAQAYSFSNGFSSFSNTQCSRYANATNVMHYLLKTCKLTFAEAYKQVDSMTLYHSSSRFFPGYDVKASNGNNYTYHDHELELLYCAMFRLETDGRLAISLPTNFIYEKYYAEGKPFAGTLQAKLDYILKLHGLILDHDSDYNSKLIFTLDSSKKLLTNGMVSAIDKKAFKAIFEKDIATLQTLSSNLEADYQVTAQTGASFLTAFSVLNSAQISGATQLQNNVAPMDVEGNANKAMLG